MNGSSQSQHRRRSASAFSESSWLRLFVIEHAQPQAETDNPDRGFGECGSVEPFQIRRTILVALNRYAVGSLLADREVARAGTRETPLLSAAFLMSALPRTATAERTCWHVSNVPISEIDGLHTIIVRDSEQRRWYRSSSAREARLLAVANDSA